MRSRVLISLILFGLSHTAYAADWLYTVRPDDKLWNLAATFCGTNERWRDLANYNGLTDPARLQPGSRLKFPIAWLAQQPATAQVLFALGEVYAQDRGPSQRQAVQVGAQLTVGTRLLTGADSYVTVEFADGSQLQLGPDADVTFDTLSNYGTTGMVDTRVRVTRGAAKSQVTPQRGAGSVYRIGTPLGVAAVRGTDFRTRANSGASFVETLTGAVNFDAGKFAQHDLEQGQGLKADLSGVVVEDLLEAPTLESAARLGSYEALQWQPVAGAVGYVVQLYEAGNPRSVLASYRVQNAAFGLVDVAAGSYLAGVAAEAASGIVGQEAQQPLDVFEQLAAPGRIRTTGGRPRAPTLGVQWRAVPGAETYEVTLTGRNTAPQTVVVDAPATEFADLKPDTYEIAVVAVAGTTRSEPAPLITRTIREPTNWPLWVVSALTVLALVL